MELRVLEYFLAVAREESITKAAEVLHVTQPTLSRQLSGLEAEVGARLFKRGTRKITLTAEGLLLNRRAQEIIQLVSRTKEELREQQQQVEGRISIGCGETAAVRRLAEMFGEFGEKFPRVGYDIFTANADLVKEQMDKGLVDIGLLLEPVDTRKYEFIRLDIKEKWVCLMPMDSHLAGNRHVTAKELSALPLVLPRRPEVKNEIGSWFGDYYQSLNVLFTGNFSTNGGIMVEQKLAYSLVVEGSTELWDKSKIISKPLFPPLTATSVLAWKRNQPFSPAVTKFIEYIKCLKGMGDT